MNIRQQKYKENRITLGMNQFDAAMAAGYSFNYASKRSKQLEKVVNIEGWLNQVGLTDKQIAYKLFKKTEATKNISCNIFIEKDGQMKKADGKSLDFIEVPDEAIQLKALEDICRIKGLFKDSPLIDQSKHTHLTKIENKPIMLFELDVKKDKDADRDLSTDRISSSTLQ